MSEGEPPRPPPNFKKQNGGLCAQNWRAIACPPLGSGTVGQPTDTGSSGPIFMADLGGGLR